MYDGRDLKLFALQVAKDIYVRLTFWPKMVLIMIQIHASSMDTWDGC